MMKDALKKAVQCSFFRLLQEEGSLFDCPIEEDFPYDARKLHEVCINHKLANYLEHMIFPLLPREPKMFVDIEFNREGLNYKAVRLGDEDKRVRPDIVVHNRRSNKDKINFLVVECKKEGSLKEEIEEDFRKIYAMMEDERYSYTFGLQVIYGKSQIKSFLFYKYDTGIKSEKMVVRANKAM